MVTRYTSDDNRLADDQPLYFGDDQNFSIFSDGTDLYLAPGTDDGGVFYLGNASEDCDVLWYSLNNAKTVEFNAGTAVVNFADVDIALDDDAILTVGVGSEIVLSSDGTDGTIDGSGIINIGPTNAGSVTIGVSTAGTFVKSRLVQHAPARGAATTTANLSDAQILSGILIGTTSAAANYTLRTGTEIETALEAIVGAIATNDSFELVIVNLGGTTGWDITLVDGGVAGMTIIGNPVIGALADVATEQESQGTFRFIRTAENTFDVIRIG